VLAIASNFLPIAADPAERGFKDDLDPPAVRRELAMDQKRTLDGRQPASDDPRRLRFEFGELLGAGAIGAVAVRIGALMRSQALRQGIEIGGAV
jgi:hypothetical protein